MRWATTGSRFTADEGELMATIGDLLNRDLSRKIEEIIQVDQANEQSVHDEITEYVATDSIREQYHRLFRAIADAPSEPDESIGVWRIRTSWQRERARCHRSRAAGRASPR
jgi:hypothetical protein